MYLIDFLLFHLYLQNYENSLKSMDFYDSKFDLGALSIAELSLESSSDVQDYGEYKRAIKFSLFFQPAFCVCWFLGVVALENRQSCVMPVIFVICYNILVCTCVQCIFFLHLSETTFLSYFFFLFIVELVYSMPFPIYYSIGHGPTANKHRKSVGQ